jgi:hypothetical protein
MSIYKVQVKKSTGFRSSSKSRGDVYSSLDFPQDSISTCASDFEDFFKAKKEWEDHVSSYTDTDFQLSFTPTKSVSTIHSSPKKQEISTSLGVNYSLVERKVKGGKWCKSPRSAHSPKREESFLHPNYDVVKTNHRRAVISQPVPKNPKLIKKQREMEIDEKIAAIVYKYTEREDEFAKDAPGGVIAPLVERMPKPDKSKLLGPGNYDVSYKLTDIGAGCAVKYVAPQEIYKPIEQMPDPGTYNPQLQDRIPLGVIGKEVRAKSPEEDRRKPLQINDELIRKRPPMPVINPEPSYIPPPPEPNEMLGPGQYDPIHKLTEARVDKGVPVFHEPAPVEPEVDYRPILNPSDEAIRPNKPSFVYHEPVFHEPLHLPQSAFHPEQWKFYDPVEVKFDRAPEPTFSRNIPQEEWTKKEEMKEQELRYYRIIKGDKPVPPVGTYDPEPVKETTPAYDFGKRVGREEDNFDEDDVQEGDVLVLEPDKPRKVPVLVNMEKATGRPEPVEDEYKEELILEPKLDFVKPKVPSLVNMAKESGRPEVEIPENEELIISPKYDAVRPKIVSLVDMSRQIGRPVHTEDADTVLTQGGNEIYNPNLDLIKPRVPILVNMDKQTGRLEQDQKFELDEIVITEIIGVPDPFKPRVLSVPDFDKNTGRKEPKKEVYDSEGMDVEKARKAVEPEVHIPSFDRYAFREDDVIELEEFVVVYRR